MVKQTTRLGLLMLIASVSVCVTFGRQYKGKGWGSRRDPCNGYYCANGGSCILDNDCGYGYRYPTPTCQCTGDWTGDRCDDNPCIDVDCNMGTCYYDINGTPHCCCPEGASGDFCENTGTPCNYNCKASCDIGIYEYEVTSETCTNGDVCCRVELKR